VDAVAEGDVAAGVAADVEVLVVGVPIAAHQLSCVRHDSHARTGDRVMRSGFSWGSARQRALGCAAVGGVTPLHHSWPCGPNLQVCRAIEILPCRVCVRLERPPALRRQDLPAIEPAVASKHPRSAPCQHGTLQLVLDADLAAITNAGALPTQPRPAEMPG
jgi:hypothetical protein